MPYISADALQQARRIDLLSYLQTNEPGNLVRISGNNYCTREHDSLKISNGKWFWFSRGIGGYKVEVKLHPEVTAELLLNVTEEK